MTSPLNGRLTSVIEGSLTPFQGLARADFNYSRQIWWITGVDSNFVQLLLGGPHPGNWTSRNASLAGMCSWVQVDGIPGHDEASPGCTLSSITP